MSESISRLFPRPSVTPPPPPPPPPPPAAEVSAPPGTNEAAPTPPTSPNADAIDGAAHLADEPLPFPAADAPRSASVEGLSEAYESFVAANPDLRPQADAVIQQINDPMGIKQEGYDTCSATVVQRALAGSEPLNYFNTATKLMTGGDTSRMEPPLTLDSANRDYAMREQKGANGQPDPVKNVNELMQAALMEFGNGAASYDLPSGASRGEGDIYSEGLTESQAKDLFETVLGRPPLLQSDITPTNGDPAALKNLITGQLKEKGDLYLPLDFGQVIEVSPGGREDYGYKYNMMYEQEPPEPVYETIESNMSHMVKIEGEPYAVTPTGPNGKPYMVGNPPQPYSYQAVNVINPTTGKGEVMALDAVVDAAGRANGKAAGGPYGIKPPPPKPKK